MGLLTRTSTPNEHRATLRDTEGFLFDWLLGGREALSGEVVSPTTSLGLSAYFAAMRAISEDTSTLPFHVYQTVGRSKKRLRDHLLEDLFNCEANEWTSSMAFRETIVSHAIAWGNGYAEIVRDRGGVPKELIGWDPTRVTPFFNDARRLVYDFRGTGAESKRTLPAADVFHIHGLGFDGLMGYSIASIARDSLGLGLAAQNFAGSFYKNGAHFSGIVKTSKFKDENARQNFQQSLEGKTGVRKAGRLFHAEGGDIEFIPLSMAAKDAQFLETRVHQVREVARWFRIAPHMIGDLADATFSNITELEREHVVYTLMPWFVRIEQEVKRKLITPEQRNAGIFAKHVVEGLLRGDMQARYSAYAIGRQWGWESPNSVLELEDRNPLPGDQGDIFLVPGNMIPADQVGKEPDPPPPPALPAPDDGDEDEKEGDDARRSVDGVISSFGPTLTATFDRLIRVAHEKVERNRKRDDFDAWIKAFASVHEQHVAETIEPVVRSMLSAAWSIQHGGELPTALAMTVQPLSTKMAEGHGLEMGMCRVPGQESDLSLCFAVASADRAVAVMIQTARTLGE